MSVQSGQPSSPCDACEIEWLFDDKVDPNRIAMVERHLTECGECAEKVHRMAASGEAWTQVSDFLSSDDFDPVDAVNDLARLSTAEVHSSRQATSRMLAREIQGWLDPTDDPRMLGRFAGYEVVGIVGHGGMGIVLKGFEASLNRYVAIKVLAPRLATSPTARRRFAREAQAAAAVLHENVVAIHRVDEIHDLPFLVMPYFAGESLQQRIDRTGPLSLEATLRIGVQIARGLAAAHAQGLVHRDIKPANILLEPGIERVQITDFGLARAVDDGSLTRTGIIAGTPEYMSPEQASGGAIDARSDLFSLGSVLQACLLGRSPFRANTTGEAIDRVRRVDKRGLRLSDPSIPLWMESLVDKLHQYRPEARWPDATTVAETLEQCSLHVQAPDHPLPMELTKYRSKPTVISTALLAVFAVVLALISLDDRRSPAPETTEPKQQAAAVRTSDDSTKYEPTGPDLATDVLYQIDTAISEVESELAKIESIFVVSEQE